LAVQSFPTIGDGLIADDGHTNVEPSTVIVVFNTDSSSAEAMRAVQEAARKISLAVGAHVDEIIEAFDAVTIALSAPSEKLAEALRKVSAIAKEAAEIKERIDEEPEGVMYAHKQSKFEGRRQVVEFQRAVVKTFPSDELPKNFREISWPQWARPPPVW